MIPDELIEEWAVVIDQAIFTAGLTGAKPATASARALAEHLVAIGVVVKLGNSDHLCLVTPRRGSRSGDAYEYHTVSVGPGTCLISPGWKK